jgi:diguanylate cyclase (GGDEF)-like protein
VLTLEEDRDTAVDADAERIAVALADARAHFRETLSESLSTARTCFAQASALHDHALCARALTLQGEVATHRGDLREAARLAFEAERHALETNDAEAMVEIASLRSHIYFFTGSYAQALSHADHAISIADRSGDPTLRTQARRAAYLVFGNIKVRGWRERLRELLALTRETNSLWEETVTRNDLACELLDDGDVAGASAEIERAMAVAHRITGPNTFVLAVIHCTRADINLALGDPSAALADTQRSRTLLQSIDDPNPYVNSANVRAEVQAHAALGNLDEAERVGDQALALLGDQMPRSRSQILATLATALRAGGRLERAYDVLLRSAELERQAFAEISELQLDLEQATRRARAARRESVELAAKNRELAAAQAELQRRADQLEKLQAQLIEQADRDWLTGLRNRRYLARALGHTAPENLTPPFSVAVLDLDHFKQINDRFGHAAGDQVLVRVAELLGEATRESDVVVRSGGEEFLVVMAQTGEHAAAVCCERMRAAICSARWDEIDPELTLTASVGVASAGASTAMEPLVRLADQRLFEAKRAGRNRVVS